MPTIMDAHGKEHKVRSNGQIDFATVGGAGGIGWLAEKAGLFNNGCCGNGGGLFGGNNNNGCYVTEKENAWIQAYNAKNSEVDMLKSDIRTDGKILDLYNYTNGELRRIERETDARFTATGASIAELAAKQAVTNEKLNGTISLLDAKIDASVAALDGKINCNVAAIYKEIDCRTMPLEKKVPLSSICPRPQPACEPVVNVDIVGIANELARVLKSAK